jgi:hypothetical protein
MSTKPQGFYIVLLNNKILYMTFHPTMGNKGQVGLPAVLAAVILIFVIFTVGNSILNNTALDPDSTNGGTQNQLMNIALVTMAAVVIIGLMASIVLRLF